MTPGRAEAGVVPRDAGNLDRIGEHDVSARLGDLLEYRAIVPMNAQGSVFEATAGKGFVRATRIHDGADVMRVDGCEVRKASTVRAAYDGCLAADVVRI